MALRPVRRLTLVSAAAVVALSCGGDKPGPVAPIVPTPTPVAPINNDVNQSSTCPIGNGHPTSDCGSGSPQLRDAVFGAIDKLVAEKPKLFDLNREDGPNTGQYLVLDRNAYFDGVIANLRLAGFCADRSLDRERLVLKSSNDFSEEWDIITSPGFIRRYNSYVSTCRPASFPVEPADLISYIWVGYFAFDCSDWVGTPPPMDQKDQPIDCDAFITASPKMVNRQNVPAWIHGDDVTWSVRYGQNVIEVEEDWQFGSKFNRFLHPKALGDFSVCASVMGKTGCLNGTVIPNPSGRVSVSRQRIR